MSGLMSADYLKIFIPIVGAIITWVANERRKRKWEEYQRKEAKYQALLKSLKGFYTSPSPEEAEEAKVLKQAFLEQLDLCWLYCPDELIKKAYVFLSCVHTSIRCTDEEKEKALGELVLAIRKDLLSRKIVRKTELKPEDFKILKPT